MGIPNVYARGELELRVRVKVRVRVRVRVTVRAVEDCICLSPIQKVLGILVGVRIGM